MDSKLALNVIQGITTTAQKSFMNFFPFASYGFHLT